MRSKKENEQKNQLMIFENHEVEVFELDGQVLFNPYHVGECLELGESAVRKAKIGRASCRERVSS